MLCCELLWVTTPAIRVLLFLIWVWALLPAGLFLSLTLLLAFTFYTQDLRGKYEAAQDLVSSLKRQLAESDNERRSLEQKILQLKGDLDRLSQAKEDVAHDANRFRSSAELLGR